MNDHVITTRFVDANGLRFEVHECGGGDRLALCLHGFPEHAYAWRHQLPLLARLGYRAWAPCLRGYGKSSRPSHVADYHMAHLTADVAGLIDAAGARSTVLVGHDWGGGIAWATALGRIRPIERLIILNAPHPALFVAGLLRWPQIRRSWYIFAFQLPILPELLLRRRHARAIANAFLDMAVDKTRFPTEVLDVYRRGALEPGALRAMLNYYRANRVLVRRTRARHPDPSLTRPIETPTLMIWGEADTALGKELTYGTDRLVTDLTLRYLPGVSHWVQQEAPERVNELIETWLTRVPEREPGRITGHGGSLRRSPRRPVPGREGIRKT